MSNVKRYLKDRYIISRSSVKMPNCLESLNSLGKQRVEKVDRWWKAGRKQRWLAAALLDSEPRLRRIKGSRTLHLLRRALLAELQHQQGGRLSAGLRNLMTGSSLREVQLTVPLTTLFRATT